MGRPLIFAANWKMNHTPDEARAFAATFCDGYNWLPERRYWVFPSAVAIEATNKAFAGTPMLVGAQDIHWEPKGAFTGANSAHLVRAAGARAVLVGHSERRHVFGETDLDTGKKVKAALDGELLPLLCVGEKLDERESGQTLEVVMRQLRAALRGLSAGQVGKVVVAYEPVWAIGTGRNATPTDAALVHHAIRLELKALGNSMPKILYGGSVNLENVESLLAEEELDGVLVGGASLDVGGWRAITQLSFQARSV